MENQEIVMCKDVEVDGYRYKITHPQVESGWETGVELMKMIGGPAAAMAQCGGDEEKVAKALTDAVMMFLQKVDPATSMRLIKKVLSTVELQGPVDGVGKKMMLNDVGIKSHFQARIGSMMRLTGAVIDFTHSDFFDAIADGIASMMTKASEKMQAA